MELLNEVHAVFGDFHSMENVQSCSMFKRQRLDYMASRKFYAVRSGIVPGIYINLEEAHKQIKGYSNFEMKSFNNLGSAEEYMDGVTYELTDECRKAAEEAPESQGRQKQSKTSNNGVKAPSSNAGSDGKGNSEDDTKITDVDITIEASDAVPLSEVDDTGMLAEVNDKHENHPRRLCQIPEYVVYTDGSCKSYERWSTGVGGYAAVVMKRGTDTGYVLRGSKNDTTSLNMELMALVRSLQSIKDPSNVYLYTDCMPIVNAIQQEQFIEWEEDGWKQFQNKPELLGLWQRLNILVQKHRVWPTHVSSYTGITRIELCDRVAKEEVEKHIAENTKLIGLGREAKDLEKKIAELEKELQTLKNSKKDIEAEPAQHASVPEADMENSSENMESNSSKTRAAVGVTLSDKAEVTESGRQEMTASEKKNLERPNKQSTRRRIRRKNDETAKSVDDDASEAHTAEHGIMKAKDHVKSNAEAKPKRKPAQKGGDNNSQQKAGKNDRTSHDNDAEAERIGKKRGRRGVDEKTVKKIMELLNEGNSVRAVSAQVGLSPSSVQRVKKRQQSGQDNN